MDTSRVGNYSVRLHPEHRRMLVTLARLHERRPSDVVRRLIQFEYQRLHAEQKEAGDD